MSVAITQLHRSSWNRNQGGHYKIELPVGHSISCSTYSQTSSSAYYWYSQSSVFVQAMSSLSLQLSRGGCRITTASRTRVWGRKQQKLYGNSNIHSPCWRPEMNVDPSYLLNRFHSGYSATGTSASAEQSSWGLSPWYYYAVSHASDSQSVQKSRAEQRRGGGLST